MTWYDTLHYRLMLIMVQPAVPHHNQVLRLDPGLLDFVA